MPVAKIMKKAKTNNHCITDGHLRPPGKHLCHDPALAAGKVRIATMRQYIAATLIGSILLPLAGCANYTQPIVAQEPLTPKERNFETLWQGSIELLRTYDFPSDPLRGGLQDRRAGIIRTAPVVGRHWFELWRKDYAGEFDGVEGTLQTIYRQVTIHIKPASADSTQYDATIEVQTFRSDRTQRWQAHDSQTVYGMFQLPGQTTSEHGLLVNEPTEPRGAAIVPLGRNPDLEAKMAKDLTKILAKQAAKGKSR
jgi:hypothetical protein